MRKSTILFILAGILGLVIVGEIIYLFFIRSGSNDIKVATPANITVSPIPTRPSEPAPTSVVDTMPENVRESLDSETNTVFALNIEGQDSLSSGTASLGFEGAIREITIEDNVMYLNFWSAKTSENIVFYFNQSQMDRITVYQQQGQQIERSSLDNLVNGSRIKLTLEIDLLKNDETAFKSITITRTQ